jgi:hypothetical protein
MKQSPSCEANWFAASQEIPRVLRKPKVHQNTAFVLSLEYLWQTLTVQGWTVLIGDQNVFGSDQH